MGIVRLALDNIYGVIVMALMILVLGTVALLSIPVDILPAFKTPAVQVLTYFNGMPAASMEKTITNRIERWVNQAPGVRLVESRSLSSVSVVRVYFRDEVEPTAALTMANSLALGALPMMPPNTLPPVVLPFDPTATLPLGILTVSNPQMEEAKIKDLARYQIRNMLGSVKGSVAPVVIGGKDRAVLVYLDPKRLEARNLSMSDIVQVLQDGNLMVTPGTAYFGDNQVLLDTNAMVAAVEDLDNLPIRLPNGRVIQLRDVGHAEDAASIQTSRVRINGLQQVYIPIYRQGGASSLAVASGVADVLPRIEQSLPEGTNLEFVMDQSGFVRKSIRSLIEEGLIGVLLVAVMILVFLGNWRMTFIAVVALPLAILAAVVGLWGTGNTINVMTLGGLFLAIGPLVDNAIVVLENTHRHLKMGKSPYQAALDALGELTLPVLVATLALIIVLCPIALTPGIGGFLFKPLTLAVAFSMLASFALAWTLVPAFCSQLLKPHATHHAPEPTAGNGHANGNGHAVSQPGIFERIYARIAALLAWLNRGYVALLTVALQRRGLVLVGVGLVFVASLTQLRTIGREYFPAVDAGQIIINVRAPSNSRLESTERRIAEVEAVIAAEIPPHERAMILSEIGLTADWSAAYTANAGQQDAIVRVQLTEERSLSAQEYAIKLRKVFAEIPDFADLQFSFNTGGMVAAALNFGTSSPINIQITGGQFDQAMSLAQQIARQVRDVPGTADVRVQQRNDAPYLVLDVDRMKAAEVGLTARDVMLQVVAAINSSTSINRNFWIDNQSGNQYYVAVQYPEDPDRRLEDLQNVFATGTRTTVPVSLSSLVKMRPHTAAVEVNHSALQRVVNVLVNCENRDIGSVAADINRQLAKLELPRGMRIEMLGEYANMTESTRSLGAGLALAAILVYLLMVPLMRSFVIPLIIMVTVPLGLIGVLTVLNVTGTTLNVQSQMGVIFLVGIVVAQGVLLMDFANRLRRGGVPVQEAVMQAARIRFLPIIMTFLAAFLDLLPIAIGLGKGSEALTPLARAVVGGLVTSTGLMLFVVPILYTLFVRDERPPMPSAEALARQD
jgi:multidrug efflux pump subunit AcrB